MDQSELRNLEAKCIQESPPPCITACPLHVDIRGMASALQQRDIPAALKIIRKNLPFPAIIGRICDQPCQAGCNRRSLGGAIQVAALERACTSLGPTAPPGFLIPPSTAHKIAIVGSGLSGMTAAFDLAKKGYSVTLFEAEEKLGGHLREYPESILPSQIVASELAVLEVLKIQTRLNTAVDSGSRLEALLLDFEAVYLDPEAPSADSWGLAVDDAGFLKVDPVTLTTSRPGVIAGERTPRHLPYSPIRSMAEGRRGAVTLDRYLQKASLTASRSNEGPYPSSLYTNLKNLEPQPAAPMADPLSGYSLAEAVREASRCLRCECLECVKACHYLKSFGAFPRPYIRQIYNNESMVMGSHAANRLINSCTLCGLCEALCPNHLAMQDICLEARRRMVRSAKMPPSAFEFALLDLQFSRSEQFALARHAPGQSTSRFVFFPGCQLSASHPAQVRMVYDYLLANLAPDCGLVLNCCGAPAFWAGEEKLFQQQLADLRAIWQQMGQPRFIVTCSTCYQLFRENLAEIPLESLWEVLDKRSLPPVSQEMRWPTLAVHDPCTTRHAPSIQDAVRSLLKKRGVPIEELALSRDLTECCGFGGLVGNSNPALADAITQKRARESPRDYLVYCAMCRDNLAKTGKRTLHLLDLIFPSREAAEALEKPVAGWSARRENRYLLKQHLLKEKWQEEPEAVQEYRQIKLQFDPGLAAILEKRRILVEDLQQTIEAAEKSGCHFYNPQNNHLTAYFKPRSVTFWVEYSRQAEGYLVHNAYSHRMEVARS
jgi:glutamate synthase (NADPH) small chain